VQKNLREKCLPIDYFMERMLQVGLCRTMSSLKHALSVALQFDNPGLVGQKQDYKHFLDREPDEGPEPKIGFVPLNRHNKEALKYMRNNLEKDHLEVTDRVSVNQFLSLFNVHGVENANRLDRLVEVLKKRVSMKKKVEQKKTEENKSN